MFESDIAINPLKNIKEKIFFQAFENNPIPKIIEDKNGEIVLVNNSFCKLLLFDKNEILNKKIDEFFNCENANKINNHYKTDLKNNKIKHYKVLRSFTTKNGIKLFIQLNCTGIFNQNNTLLYSYIAFNDKTESIEKEEIINSMISTLSIKNNELNNYIKNDLQLENFAYMASHDLKGPVQNIINYSNLIQKRCFKKFNSEEKKYLNFLSDSANEMKNSIDTLLNYSIFKNNKINCTTFNVLDLLKKVKQTYFNSYDIDFFIDFENIYADQIFLSNVFIQLLNNCVKFKSPDRKLKVKIEAEKHINEYVFKIKDNGIGFDEKYRTKIFGLFKKLNVKNKFKGNGIGLAICKCIVEKHFGELWAESEINSGSTFIFTIKIF